MAGYLGHSKLVCRFYHSSTVSYAAVHKTFRKVMGANSGKKRNFKFQDGSVFPKATKLTDITEGATKGKSPTKRTFVLNKMFMRHITDLMVNGEHWEQYSKFGIEINNIQVSPDYRHVQIYWVSEQTDRDAEIVSFLADEAFNLRHQLSQLLVMGAVPPIVFIKDKHRSEVKDLDRRMAIADYGDDYEPVAITRMKHQLELYSPLDENIKLKLQELDSHHEGDDLDVELPIMTQNVLGLDHAGMMSRMMKLKTKSEPKQESKAEHKMYEDIGGKLSSRDAFKLFLQKRQVINERKNKENKNYSPDMEYIKQEMMEKSSMDHYENIESNLDKFDEDFVDEDNETK